MKHNIYVLRAHLATLGKKITPNTEVKLYKNNENINVLSYSPVSDRPAPKHTL